MPDTSPIRVKICGLKTPEMIAAAVDNGAAYIGFMFFKKSPRYVAPELAGELALLVPPGIGKVAVTVNASNEELDAITEAVPLDFLQLHGAETPERVAEIRERYGLPVIKVIGIASATDLDQVAKYAHVADQLLVETKASKSAKLPGGNGVPFDWSLLKGFRWPVPWMLAGGLNAGNSDEAVRLTGANQLDLSSGVETAPGVKDANLIRKFLENTQKQAAPKLR